MSEMNRCDKCGAPLLSVDEVRSIAYTLKKQHDQSIFGTVAVPLDHFFAEAQAIAYERRLKEKK